MKSISMYVALFFATFANTADALTVKTQTKARMQTKAQRLEAANQLQDESAAQEKSVAEQNSGQVLQAGNRGSSWRIPRQLILTGKYPTKEDWPEDVKENMKKLFEQNPELEVKWFNDIDCSNYLKAHPELGLYDAFERERRGSYRGDICRTAVLSREGGFYQDLDVELKVPFRQLVDDKTSFMSVYSESGGILNALFATERNGSVVQHTLQELQRWYHVPGVKDGNWMGPETMLRGLNAVVENQCSGVNLLDKRYDLQWSCGKDMVRLYQEKRLYHCDYDSSDDVGCTPLRAYSNFEGLKFAIFKPNTSDLIGWPRYEKCPNFGCAIGGWDES